MNYQDRDGDCIDYQCYRLDGVEHELRGPKPGTLEAGKFFACLGSAHTFGVHCLSPYPELLKREVGLEVLNLSVGSAGPEYFSSQKEIIRIVNRARFVVVQITSARGASNSEFEAIEGGKMVSRVAGREAIPVFDFYQNLIDSRDYECIARLVAESRETWVESYRDLLQQISVPKILFWFSKRKPAYVERYDTVSGLFGAFPQLVNEEMIRELMGYADVFASCVTRRGIPQPLINRYTGESASIVGRNGMGKEYNRYYPSPEMHVDAANSLLPLCLAMLEKEA